MSPEHTSTKAALRKLVYARLKAMPASALAGLSDQLVVNALSQPLWTQAKSVLLFSPMAGEPDIRTLIRAAKVAGKLTALPGFDAAAQSYSARFIRDPDIDLAEGAYGIFEPRSSCEPAPLNRLDLVLVPGVAFDAEGWRLGRGKGFYDRLLTQVCGTTCGVAFDEQIVEAIPVDPHDVRLNCILTPTRLIES